MIIKGTFIFTPEFGQLTIKENLYLHISDGKVTQFYDKVPDELESEELIDYSGKIIIPAFNDLHVHAPQYINRGIGFDEELLPWLNKYTFPVESKYSNPEFATAAYSLFLNKLKLKGTMRFCAFATLHKDSAWKLMELTEKSGMKAYIGKVNMDRNSPDFLIEDTDKSIAETEELIIKSQSLKNVDYILTPRFVPSTTSKMMSALGNLGEKYNLAVQSHLSENKAEIEWVRELHPDIASYTEVYKEYGLLRKNQTIMAHSIHLTDTEKKILKDYNVMLAHCAQSNADLSSGIMQLRKNIEDGLRCSIASDVAGGHTLGMNRHIAYTIEISKINAMYNPAHRPLTLPEALYLATKESGSFFGKVGSFEKDFDFDALVISTDELNGLFEKNPFEELQQFIYDGDDRNIIARYCAGKEITNL